MGQISMRTALSLSRNIPALKAFQQVQKEVGNKKILEFATSLGIHPEISNGVIHEAHSLGAFSTKEGTSPLQMAAAYAAFANGGTYHEPLTVNKIIFRETGEVKNCEGSSQRVMKDSTAFMITDMLVTAVESGLSSGAKINGVTVAAKTGTSSFTDELKELKNYPGNAINDAWIVGYDPEYAISMWYGYEQAEKGYYNTDIQAVNARSALYKALGNAVFNKNGQQFRVPDSVVKVALEVGSTNLPSASTPEDQIVYEYFIKGAEPTETSQKYNKIATPTGLKVQYNEEKSQLIISWNKQNTPTGNDSYGNFGYKIYFEDNLIAFTQGNSYTITANANISGTYKVTAAFENYQYNESAPASYNYTYNPNPSPSTTPKPTPTPTETASYTLSLNGTNPVSIPTNGQYTDTNDPITILKNGTITNEAHTITTSIKGPNGVVDSID